MTVDTVTDDLVLTDPDEVSRYEDLYERLWDASMSVQTSLRFLIDSAKVPSAV